MKPNIPKVICIYASEGNRKKLLLEAFAEFVLRKIAK